MLSGGGEYGETEMPNYVILSDRAFVDILRTVESNVPTLNYSKP